MQQRAKAHLVEELLSASAVPVPHEPRWISGPEIGYRNRIRLAIVDGSPQFFNAEKGLGCVVLEPSLQAAVSEFRIWARDYHQALQAFRVAEVRAADADGKAAVYLRHTERNGEQRRAPDRRAIADNFSLGYVAFEAGPIVYQRTYATSGVWLWNPVGAFGQINSIVNQRMVQTVVDWLLERGTLTFLDLFSGSGNFSVPLRAAGLCGTAVEWDAVGCRAHERTLQSHGFDGVNVICGDALSHAERQYAAGQHFHAVIVDPPRRGLRGDVGAVSRLAQHTIVVVSCNARQFAADAAAICSMGFRLSQYRLVDMFPHTEHVELIALFERV